MLRWKEVFKKGLRDLIFDTSCSCCHNEIDREGYICSKCLEKLKEEAFLKNKDEFYYVFIYEKAIRQIIADYKLRNRKNLAKDLTFLIKKPFYQLLEREKIDIIIPVPISEDRKIERGFNQIEYLLELLDVKFKKIERIKNTKHMYDLKDHQKREKNVESAFKNDLDLSDKTILLVDDIVTTGATIKAIIGELKRNNKNIDIKIFSIAISKYFEKR